MSDVTLVGPLEEDAVREAWPKVEGWLADALERDGWKVRPEDLLGDIASGAMGLYVAQDFATGDLLGAATTEVQEYPNARVFSVAYCGGREVWRWAHLLGGLEREAARFGCQIVRIPGRKGWGRVFPDYREVYRVFEREVVQ